MYGLKQDSKFSERMVARFRCECHAHEIEVCQWQDDEWDDNDVYLDFYYSGRNWRTVDGKLKALWRVLRGKPVFQEEIILSPEDAHELGQALLAVHDQKDRT